MSRWIWIVLGGTIIVVWGVALTLLLSQRQTNAQSLPTRVVLLSLTDDIIPAQTSTATITPSTTHTPNPTPTPTPTKTTTPTTTPTLAVRLLEVTAIMPGVVIPPTQTPLPSGKQVLYAPPNPLEPLPDATYEAPPYRGWYSFESDHPAVRYAPVRWTPCQVREASRGQYHRYESTGIARFSFEGEAVRVRYVAARNMGIFEVVVDGQVIDTVDAYRPSLQFPGTQIYTVGAGAHLLEIRATGERNPQADGAVAALDAIQVFRADDDTLIIPYPDTPTPAVTPRPARSIELISAPPTRVPSATPPPPVELSIAVVIAYDENGNREVDLAEGVAGIPVRAVAAATNQIIGQGITNERGHAQLQVVTAADVRVVVPYFGEVWDVPRRSSGTALDFTLLIEPGNQPGIIP